MKKLYFLVVTTFVVTLSFGQNIAVNGGFENWTSGSPDSWSVIDFNTTDLTQNSIFKTEGLHSAAINLKTQDQALTDIRQQINLTNGITYLISLDVFATDNQARVRIFESSFGTNTYSNVAILNQWQTISFFFTPSADGMYQFGMRFYDTANWAGGSSQFYIDNFDIKSSPTAAEGDIIITEIMKDPSKVTDANGEYFEVYNTTSSDIDMYGWIISDDGSESHTINSTVIVNAGDYAIFCINSNSSTNGGVIADYQYNSFSLGNDDDEIVLTNNGTEIDRVVYDNGTNFPDLTGESIELHLFYYDAISNDNGSNWGAATTAYGIGDLGTPGAENDFGLSVVKNEIENFSMYPNPVSNGKLYMSSGINLNKEVQIYALTGHQVYSNNLQNQEPLNISNLNKGIYIVRIKEEGKIATRKLVVN